MDMEHNAKQGAVTLPSFDRWLPDVRANYGGTCRKDGLIGPDGSRYMVKFAKRQELRSVAAGHADNVVSEYVSSHVLGILGYQVQETELGTLHGETVVSCKNFVPPDAALVVFGTFLRTAVLEDPKELLWRSRRYPAAALALRPGVRVNYYDLMSSGIFDELYQRGRPDCPTHTGRHAGRHGVHQRVRFPVGHTQGFL